MTRARFFSRLRPSAEHVSACGRPNEAPRRTREKNCGTQGNTSSKLHTHWKALPVVGALFAATQDLVCLSGEKKKQKRFYLQCRTSGVSHFENTIEQTFGTELVKYKTNKQTNKSNSLSVQSCSLLFSSFLFHSVYFCFSLCLAFFGLLCLLCAI